MVFFLLSAEAWSERQILLDRMVVYLFIFLQEKGNHRCLEIMKRRGTGWR